MAFNNFYQPYSNYPQFQQSFQQPIQPSAPQVNSFQNGNNFQQSIQPQIQNGGFISVRNEQEARNYPIAPGNSVTFKDENMPYVYVKTMGFSQLDRPNFEKFRLVKEEEIQAQQTAQNPPVSNENTQQTNNVDYAKKDEITALWSEIDALKSKLFELTDKTKGKNEKSEVKTDE